MEDFVNNVLPYNKIDFWKLNEGLSDILININSNPLIQALYSKRPSFKNPDNSRLSYLEFCYATEIELALFREVIPSLFLEVVLDLEERLYYLFDWPRNNPNYSMDSPPFGLACVDDEKYFFINTIKINLESNYQESHSSFWNNLERLLSGLKP